MLQAELTLILVSARPSSPLLLPRGYCALLLSSVDGAAVVPGRSIAQLPVRATVRL